MAEKKLLILNSQQIRQKIERMAYQIMEDNLEEKELVVAGIADRGYILAQRICEALQKFSTLKITLIRIALDKTSTHLDASTDIDINRAAGKVVILVDDVLNSGRTLAYGLGVFLDIPLKKLRTLVMINRNHRLFPVSPDYAGLELATILKEHVDVEMEGQGDKDAVYLS